MKLFFQFLFIALLLPARAVFADDQHPDAIRKQLVVALKSSTVTDSLYDKLYAVKNKTALTTGYIGALQALKAVHSWNPYNKIKYLNRSEKTFEQAVIADPHNMEIRFMRFSIEHHVPGFLGYNKNLVADRKEIIHQLSKKNYVQADHELVTTIVKFLLESKRCTPAENEYLNKQLAVLK